MFGNIVSEDRFNALVLLFVYKDTELDIRAVIDIYARKHPGFFFGHDSMTQRHSVVIAVGSLC